MNADSNGAHFSESNCTVMLLYKHFKSLLILGGGACAISPSLSFNSFHVVRKYLCSGILETLLCLISTAVFDAS